MKNILSVIFLLIAHTIYSQTILFNQGFEYRGTSNVENWGYMGGIRTMETSKEGIRSLKIGSLGLSSDVVFDSVDISQHNNLTLQISHSVLPGMIGESGLDVLEGVAFQVSLDGGNWVTISKISGMDNYHYTFNDSIAGVSSTSSSCRLFKTPNPLNYQIPQNTNKIAIRIITINSSNCRGFNYDANMGINNNFDRTDEGFYIDNVRIITDELQSSTFPVEMGQFNSNNDGNKIKLNWLTYSETNTSMFVVERSKDGIEFEELGIVYANNLGSTESYYEFIDNNPLVGDNYYRLKIIDLDYSFEYSKVIYDFIDKKIEINVYPNPILMGETINIDGEIDELFIMDLMGNIISKTNHIPNNITSGNYILVTIVNGKKIINNIMVN